jgi:NAD(P)H dehydrogenase (quinone)
MKVLIVYAHHEPKSFSAALLQQSIEILKACGHEVVVSDLYAMNFNAVADAGDFTSRRFPNALQYDREQKNAYQNGRLAADIADELEKVLWCDFMILQFPLWWYSVPAIMKGWIDRVFLHTVAYGNGMRFDAGGFKGRRAMLVMTTGCYEQMLQPDGLLGDVNVMMYHIQAGALAYTGFDVLPPYCAYSIHYTDDTRRQQYLDDYAQRLRTLAITEPMRFQKMADFGPDWRLKPDADAVDPGHYRMNEH